VYEGLSSCVKTTDNGIAVEEETIDSDLLFEEQAAPENQELYDEDKENGTNEMIDQNPTDQVYEEQTVQADLDSAEAGNEESSRWKYCSLM